MAIKEIMEVKGTPTLKAIAEVFNVPSQRIYSVAKQPKEGEVYDAKVYNWDAIERFITRRLNDELPDLDAVIDAALAVDVELKERDGRRSGNRGTPTVQKITVDGKEIPVRKYKNFEMDEDVYVCLRKDANVYKIVLQTLSHTCLRPVGPDGEFCSETVKVISNSMLNMKGAGPASVEDAIAKRFSGEYVVPADPDEAAPTAE
nr:MAG TPA: excisionase [Caudoviricetes sp.]